MFYWKLARYKWVYLLFFFAFLVMVFQEPVVHHLTFDVNAPDLANFDGEKIKQEIFLNLLTTWNLLFNLGRSVSMVMPFAIALIGYDYLSLKNRFIQLSIGKNQDYYQMRRQLKLQLALIPALIYLLVFWLAVLVSSLFPGITLDKNIQFQFLETSLLARWFSGTFPYLLFKSFWGFSACFINALFCFKLMDVTKHFLRGAGLFLAFLMPLSIALYAVLPQYLVPMTSLMAMSYGDWTLPKLLLTYLPYVLGFGVLMAYDKEI